ncbi:hypothetical protein [Aeromonas phage AS-sw]|uniref:Uncharacterized protein n=1 Tax=Aeromonas phage AS-sw TaxID=2026113 RepID=A0A291LFL6_9CAUD|nr:hypothetical protein HWB29_gp109 [Aeromonas phage AS-sw]ATI18159.1 hypothetical protein [Aeromonas phage AS-sw]
MKNFELLPTGAYAVEVKWLSGHSEEMAERFFKRHGINYEKVSIGWGNSFVITDGQYKGFYDVHADPANRTILILQDLG